MGNDGGYNNNRHFQYQQQNIKNLQKTTTFLPMLCSRTSIKDVISLPTRLQEDRSGSSNDPLSPKISCIGQVKRNNKITGFPSFSSSSSHNNNIINNNNNNNNKLIALNTKNSSLKRFFSAKNIIAATATTNTTSNHINNNKSSKSCNVSSCRRRRRREAESREREVCINIAEMDPPLPVIKSVPKPAGGGDHLWKRRSNGVAATLKTLELQHIKIPRYEVEIQTV